MKARLIAVLIGVTMIACFSLIVRAARDLGPGNWRSEILAPRLRQMEFARLFARALQERLPEARVRVRGPNSVSYTLPGGNEGTYYLDNAWADSKDDPEGRIEVVERFLDSIAHDGADPPIADRSIVPMVRDRVFMEQAKQDTSLSAPLKAEPLAADLWIVYAQDTPRNVSYLPHDFPRSYNELQPLALQNLRAIIPQIELLKDGDCYLLEAGGNYEASLLLLDEIWAEYAKGVDGELVVGVPTRDVVLFTGSRSRSGLKQLKADVRELHTKGSYPVSNRLLMRRNGKWQEFGTSAP